MHAPDEGAFVRRAVRWVLPEEAHRRLALSKAKEAQDGAGARPWYTRGRRVLARCVFLLIIVIIIRDLGIRLLLGVIWLIHIILLTLRECRSVLPFLV